MKCKFQVGDIVQVTRLRDRYLASAKTGDIGEVMRVDPGDPSLTYKVHFENRSEWFGGDELTLVNPEAILREHLKSALQTAVDEGAVGIVDYSAVVDHLAVAVAQASRAVQDRLDSTSSRV